MVIQFSGGIELPPGGGFKVEIEPFLIDTSNTWDTVNAGAGQYTFSNGDLTVVHSPDSFFHTIRTLGSVSSGKYYTEFTVDTDDRFTIFGVITIDASSTAWPGKDLEGYGYYGSVGQKIRNNSQVDYGDIWAGGDIIAMALDLDNGAIWFSKNGTWQTNDGAAPGIVSADIAAYNSTAIDGAAYTGITGTYFVGASIFSEPNGFTSNFGATDFSATPPTGFIGWPGP